MDWFPNYVSSTNQDLFKVCGLALTNEEGNGFIHPTRGEFKDVLQVTPMQNNVSKTQS